MKSFKNFLTHFNAQAHSFWRDLTQGPWANIGDVSRYPAVSVARRYNNGGYAVDALSFDTLVLRGPERLDFLTTEEGALRGVKIHKTALTLGDLSCPQLEEMSFVGQRNIEGLIEQTQKDHRDFVRKIASSALLALSPIFVSAAVGGDDNKLGMAMIFYAAAACAGANLSLEILKRGLEQRKKWNESALSLIVAEQSAAYIESELRRRKPDVAVDTHQVP